MQGLEDTCCVYYSMRLRNLPTYKILDTERYYSKLKLREQVHTERYYNRIYYDMMYAVCLILHVTIYDVCIYVQGCLYAIYIYIYICSLSLYIYIDIEDMFGFAAFTGYIGFMSI